MERAEILAKVCDLITQGRMADADNVLNAEYPRAVPSTPRKTLSDKRQVQLMLRDGFTDRYSGERLVHPGALRAVAILLGASFTYQRNWKHSETHPAFYDLCPTFDHIIPVTSQGPDDESNMVCTSMRRNTDKSSWTRDTLQPLAPVAPGWDGLLEWFLNACTVHESLRQDKTIQRWRRAAIAARAA